jgi:protein-S-isoprenylcysteine O-methyltransferase Ste14
MGQEREDGRTKSPGHPPEGVTGDRGVVVLARPPVVYLVSILVGFGLNAIWPVKVLPHALEPMGLVLVLLAIPLFALSVREFRRARTPIRTRKPVTAVIRTGPYRFSRNPIYLSFTLLQLGLGMWANSAWVVGMLIPTLVLMSYGVIAREERYMAQKFGEEYLRYTAAVRRWI